MDGLERVRRALVYRTHLSNGTVHNCRSSCSKDHLKEPVCFKIINIVHLSCKETFYWINTDSGLFFTLYNWWIFREIQFLDYKKIIIFKRISEIRGNPCLSRQWIWKLGSIHHLRKQKPNQNPNKWILLRLKILLNGPEVDRKWTGWNLILNFLTDLHKSRTFLMRIFVTFFDRTLPASRKPNPHCMNITRAPIRMRNS